MQAAQNRLLLEGAWDLLSPSFLAASIALNLPSERQPAEPEWKALVDTASVLASDLLLQTAGKRLAAPTHSARFLQAAVKLLQRAACSTADGPPQRVPQLMVLCYGCARLAVVASDGSDGRQAATVQLCEAVSCLPALLRLARTAGGCSDSMVASSCTRGAEAVCAQCTMIFQRLSAALTSSSSIHVPSPHVHAVVEAARAVLQSLPAVAVLAERLRQIGIERPQLMRNFIFQGVTLCSAASVQLAAASAAQRVQEAAGFDAAWRLHTVACQAVHWLATDPSWRQLRASNLRLTLLLEAGLEGCIQAALQLLPDSAQVPAPLHRQLQAMCSAHITALRMLMAQSEQPPPCLETFLDALQRGPPALALQPGIGDCCVRLLRSLHEVCCPGLHTAVLGHGWM